MEDATLELEQGDTSILTGFKTNTDLQSKCY
jgi:hypothetical protein